MTSSLSIRAADAADLPNIVRIAGASGLFGTSELEAFASYSSEALTGKLGPDHQWFVAVDHRIVGAAYVAPEVFADRVWNVLFIAVDGEQQGHGVGGRLLSHIEDKLRDTGQRLMLIETSGQPAFEQARAFYVSNAYEAEARIRDYYQTGDDKIVFRKVL